VRCKDISTRENALTSSAGLDGSLQTVNIGVIDEQGKFVAATKPASEIAGIVAYFDALELHISSIRPEVGTLTNT